MTPARSRDEVRRATPVNIANTGSGPANSGLNRDILKPGDYLSLLVGSEALSGIVDAVMPDGSCFWIWADCGMGRRMIDARDVASIGAEFSKTAGRRA
jgi:hypothetical protein